MKSFSKKGLAFVLVLLMCVSLLPVSAFAAGSVSFYNPYTNQVETVSTSLTNGVIMFFDGNDTSAEDNPAEYATFPDWGGYLPYGGNKLFVVVGTITVNNKVMMIGDGSQDGRPVVIVGTTDGTSTVSTAVYTWQDADKTVRIMDGPEIIKELYYFYN